MSRDEVIGGIAAMIMWCEHMQNVAYDGDIRIYRDQERILRGALELLKEQGAREQCLKTKCVVCPHCDNCDVDDNGLLKEQEPKTILGIADFIEGIEVGKCPRCERTILNKQSDPTWFCKYCGQAVKWE